MLKHTLIIHKLPGALFFLWCASHDALCLQMEQYLLRNHESRRYLQEQAFRLHQGLVTSTTQQVTDHICRAGGWWDVYLLNIHHNWKHRVFIIWLTGSYITAYMSLPVVCSFVCVCAGDRAGVCAGPGSTELSALQHERQSSAGHEDNWKPDERRQELHNSERHAHTHHNRLMGSYDADIITQTLKED